MKRIFTILLAASVLAAVSCTKESDDQLVPETDKVTMSFDATIGVPTKVELGDATAEGYKVNWSVGDEIAVLSSDPTLTEGKVYPGDAFTTTISSANANATFTGEVESGVNYYAAYPYSCVKNWSEQYDNLTVELSAVQKANGISSGILFAEAQGNQLTFKHVTGYVKFALPSTCTDVAEIYFVGNNSEVLAGQQHVSISEGQLSVKSSTYDKKSEIKLTPASGSEFEAGKEYYFTAFPAILNGFTLTFVKSDGSTASKTTEKSVTIASGDILNLGEITGLSFEVSSTKTISVDFSTIEGSVQYADETHKLSDELSISISKCHINNELRIYSSSTNNGVVTSSELPGYITNISMNVGNKNDELGVYGSSDGLTWALVKVVSVTQSYADASVDFPEDTYKYFKFDVIGTQQLRIKTMKVTYKK